MPSSGQKSAVDFHRNLPVHKRQIKAPPAHQNAFRIKCEAVLRNRLGKTCSADLKRERGHRIGNRPGHTGKFTLFHTLLKKSPGAKPQPASGKSGIRIPRTLNSAAPPTADRQGFEAARPRTTRNEPGKHPEANTRKPRRAAQGGWAEDGIIEDIGSQRKTAGGAYGRCQASRTRGAP